MILFASSRVWLCDWRGRAAYTQAPCSETESHLDAPAFHAIAPHSYCDPPKPGVRWAVEACGSLARYKTEIFLTLAFWLVAASVAFVAASSGATLFTDTPAATLATSAKYFWNQGSLADPRFVEIRDQLIEDTSVSPDARAYQDVFALARDGETLYPRHSLMILFLSAPFYGLLGDWGFWLFNNLTLYLMLVGIYRIGSQVGSSFAAALATGMLPLAAGYFLVFSYLPAYDYPPACAVVWAFYWVSKRPALAGACLALALYVRMSEAFYLPFLLLALGWPSVERLTHYGRVLTGFAAGYGPLFVSNLLLWGDPIRGAYGRCVIFRGGEMVIDPSLHHFSVATLLGDWSYRLLNGQEGLLAVMPIWAVAPLMLLFLPAGERGWKLRAMIVAALAYGLVMLSFSYWREASGPRFVFSATALLLTAASWHIHRLMTPSVAARSGSRRTTAVLDEAVAAPGKPAA